MILGAIRARSAGISWALSARGLLGASTEDPALTAAIAVGFVSGLQGAGVAHAGPDALGGDVAAVIQAWLPGQAMGDALADVLFGDAEPGGRLPVTIPAAESDCLVLHATPVDGVLEYAEGLLIGYRGYDAKGTTPRFAFGHGPGHTTWDYEAICEVTGNHLPGRHLDLRVIVRNSGSRPVREVVQAYLAGPPGDATRPVRVLAAFEIATAAPGEPTEVALRIPARAFAQWDEDLAGWIWPPGPFRCTSAVRPATSASRSPSPPDPPQPVPAASLNP